MNKSLVFLALPLLFSCSRKVSPIFKETAFENGKISFANSNGKISLAPMENPPGKDFMFGYDASFCNEPGKNIHRDDEGNEQDIFILLKNAGMDCARLRIWVDPASKDNPDFPGNSDLKTVLDQSLRAKKAGLKVMLDFHYSDYWADPGKQYVPNAWLDAGTGEEMSRRIHDYTSDVLASMKRNGASPDFVQIGNEINPGILTEKCVAGKTEPLSLSVSGKWDGLNHISYLKSAASAVRKTTPRARIVIHFADDANVRKLIKDVADAGLDFDVYGLSYYPFESSHGTLHQLGEKLDYCRSFGKDVMVVETGWYWHTWSRMNYASVGFRNLRDGDGTPLSGIVFDGERAVESVQNQANVIRAVIEMTAIHGGKGVFFWEDGKPGSWRGLFSEDGSPMPGFGAFFR